METFKSKETLFAVTDGVNWAHGKTIRKAQNDLLFKVSSRDTTPYKKLTLDSTVTHKEAIQMYRVITGACEAGSKAFVASLPKSKIKTKYTVAEIISLTKGQYRNDILSNFFKGEK